MLGFMANKRESSAFLSLAFRPFFLAASLWSALALVLWIAMLLAGVTLPSRFDPLTWHIHEMLFGFVLAAIAGFMLTAIPNWTGRLPVRGSPLAWLATLWLLGRIACLVSALIPFWVAAVADLSFPVILTAAVAREIAAGRNWRNLPMTLPVAVLSIADLLMYLEVGGFGVPAGLGWRLGLAAIVVLISVVGGRIIPSFTRNWLAKHGTVRLPAPHRWIDRCALGSLHAGMTGWAFFPGFRPLGILLLLAAALNLLRLARWRGGATLVEPLLAILHLGYLWVLAGAVLLGAAILSETVSGIGRDPCPDGRRDRYNGARRHDARFARPHWPGFGGEPSDVADLSVGQCRRRDQNRRGARHGDAHDPSGHFGRAVGGWLLPVCRQIRAHALVGPPSATPDHLRGACGAATMAAARW